MDFPKKQAQRLIPEYLLDYTTKLNESHPDPTESWGGSSVIANPTLSGNEATLDGLEVDGTKYKVGGSGGSEVHLYKHSISFYIDTHKLFLEDIYNNSSSSLTIKNEIFTAINESSNKLMCYCFNSNTTLNKITHIGHLFLSSGNVKGIIQEYNGSVEETFPVPSIPSSFNDKITQIF